MHCTRRAGHPPSRHVIRRGKCGQSLAVRCFAVLQAGSLGLEENAGTRHEGSRGPRLSTQRACPPSDHPALEYDSGVVGLKLPKAKLGRLPDAVVCANDVMAIGLTTVQQLVKRMAEAAVSMILERLENSQRSPEKRTFSGIMIDESSARLRRR